MKPLKKINQLKIIESFIQVDPYKGYAYIDLAGELVNSFYTDDKPPQFTMGLDGLIIYTSHPKLTEIKISATIYWAHLLKPDSLDQSIKLYEKSFSKVETILKPKGFNRVGWRNYFIYEFKNSNEEKDILGGLSPNKDLEFRIIGFTKKIGKVFNNFLIQPVIKQTSPPTKALMIDVDSFVQYDSPVDFNNVKADIQQIRKTLASQELLWVINSSIMKEKE